MVESILLIIDMQPRFEAANNMPTRMAVLREIAKAKAMNMPVIVVEFDGSGLSHQEILEAVKDYGRTVRVLKQQDDGSNEVLRACTVQGWEPISFTVVGVNTDACVARTVNGLLYLRPSVKIEVVKDAVNGDTFTNSWCGLRALSRNNRNLMIAGDEVIPFEPVVFPQAA